jgi:heme/copper-type cytochrome/quinol oxidase subunit 3
VGIWVFVLSDAIGFAALFVTVTALRASRDAFSTAGLGVRSDVGWGATALLAGVSALMVLARAALRGSRERRARLLCAVAALLALAFVALQGWEYSELFADAGVLSSPGHESFFVVTGYHLAHVAAGALALLWALLRRPLPLEPLSVYWHFVDGLWLFIFSFFYLL